MTPLTPWMASVHELGSEAAHMDAVSWLVEVGSITARLRTRWPALAVVVLHEGMGTPTVQELARLGIEGPAPCWLRTVRLQSDGRALVHARTVIPDWTPDNPWHQVSRLGQRPLGELLFSLPGLTRSPLEFALTTPYADAASHRSEPVPSRRRVHTRGGAPLLLTEAFDLLTQTERCPAQA